MYDQGISNVPVLLHKWDKNMDRLFKYVRRDGRNADGKLTETYLLQDGSPINLRFWYVSVSDDQDAGYDYFLQVGPVTITISQTALSYLEIFFQRQGEEIFL
jgi:hypothetical protein